MEAKHLTWDVENWVTVFFMFISAWVVISLGVRVIKGRQTQKKGS